MSEAAEAARLKEISFDKHLRQRLDEHIKDLRARPGQSAERTLAFRALQQARHWLGEDLAILGAQHPYPNGNNPANTIVDPPADVANRRSADLVDALKAQVHALSQEFAGMKIKSPDDVAAQAAQEGKYFPSCAE